MAVKEALPSDQWHYPKAEFQYTNAVPTGMKDQPIKEAINEIFHLHTQNLMSNQHVHLL